MSPAIYAFRHTVTGHIYFGATADYERRQRSWKTSIKKGYLPKKIMKCFGELDNIEFIVVEKFPPNTPMVEVRHRELDYIRETERRAPSKLMNQQHVASKHLTPPRIGVVSRETYYRRRHQGMTPEQASSLPPRPGTPSATSIVDKQGKRLSFREVAQQLGVDRATLQRRMRHKRHKYPKVTTYSIDELKASTERAKLYWKKKPKR